MSLLFKHRFGDYGLFYITEINAIFIVSAAITYNLSFPSTRAIQNSDQSFSFGIIMYAVTLMLSLLALKNASFGIAQDIFDNTIITFMQMKGRKKLFLYLYFVDVLLQGITFVLIGELIFSLGSFNFGTFWIFQFFSTYLLLGSIYFIVALLTKRPYRSFIINLIILFLFLGLYSINFVNYFLFILFAIILTLADYEIFQRLTL